jgi:ABC transport system ATP-binding/permease protein
MSARWAYAMGASTVDLNDLHRSFAGGDPGPMWDYKLSSWMIAASACAVQALVPVILLAIQLKRLDPQRKAGK